MEKVPTISVIIPVYNVEKYLRRCLDSIIAQTFSDWECILIDDGSPDGSGAICDEYAAKDTRFRVIHQANAGVSAARNAGLDAARGEYIGFIDSDDWIAADMYSFLYDLIQERGADIACCLWDNYKGETPETQVLQSTKSNVPYFNDTLNANDALTRELFHGTYITCNKLFSKKVCYNVRYDTRYINGEDRLFMVQAFVNASKVTYNMLAKYHYCHRPNSAGTKSFTPKDYMLIPLCKEVKEICKGVSPECYTAANRMENQAFVQLLYMIERLPKGDEVAKKYEKQLVKDIRKKLPNIICDDISAKQKMIMTLTATFPAVGFSFTRRWATLRK